MSFRTVARFSSVEKQDCKKAEMFWRAHLQVYVEFCECCDRYRAVERADGLEIKSKNPRFVLKSRLCCCLTLGAAGALWSSFLISEGMGRKICEETSRRKTKGSAFLQSSDI
jgi:hypothetical protein